MIADKMVASVARKLAEEVFEEAMSRDNELWRGIKRNNPHKSTSQIRKEFVKTLAPRMVEQARATLSAILGSNLSEDLKSQIYDSLIRDASLRKVRTKRGQLFTH